MTTQRDYVQAAMNLIDKLRKNSLNDKKNAAFRVDLHGADLRHISMIGMNLAHANLRETRLGFATLNEADLSGANLESANLHRAFLSDALLRNTNLSGARFRRAAQAHASEPQVPGTHFARLTQSQLDEAVADSFNPPKIDDGVVDYATGKQLVWRGAASES